MAETNDIYSESVALHLKKKGKLSIKSKVPLKNKKDLSLAYTPGVARVSEMIAQDPKKVFTHTIKQNTVGVISDGTAVLGLGNIGADAAIPVMEGKSILFKQFAGIDAFPICIKASSTEELIQTIKSISPIFGGINLEDIAAPQCFEVEAALQDLGIPVMHDDQHGTAIVVSAALINACKAVHKEFNGLKIVINGAGAAGMAIAKTLLGIENSGAGKDGKDGKAGKPHGVPHVAPADIVLVDSKGIIFSGRPDIMPGSEKERISRVTNKENRKGGLAEAVKGMDVFIGVSKANLLSQEMVRSMSPGAIVFAMANPVPEIMPDLAKAAGAAVVGTGRSDFPNQVNNVLAFPGVFRGALDAKATRISMGMKLAAAHALAGLVKEPSENSILPSPLEKGVAKAIAKAVRKQARKEGLCRPQ